MPIGGIPSQHRDCYLMHPLFFSSECYVIIDDSSLWFAGRRAKKDADTDLQLRFDIGCFLNLVTKDKTYILKKVLLYGADPPPNDTIWKAARDKNFDMTTVKCSESKREKIMQKEITKEISLCTKGKENTIVIILTENPSFKPLIESSLIPVELWYWKDSATLVQELKQSMNAQDLIRSYPLDNIVEGFTYAESSRTKKDINPAKAIQYEGIPDNAHFLYELASHIRHCVSDVFYITSVESKMQGERDFIVQFFETDPQVILKELKWLIYQPRLIDRKLKLQSEKRIATCRFGTSYELISKALQMEDTPKREVVYDARCYWKDHCEKASHCPFWHTKEEEELFARFPNIKFNYYKAKLCSEKKTHITVEEKAACAFAHDDTDSWCVYCKCWGHLLKNCKDPKARLN